MHNITSSFSKDTTEKSKSNTNKNLKKPQGQIYHTLTFMVATFQKNSLLHAPAFNSIHHALEKVKKSFYF